jgi:hypothetical protein
MNNQSLWISVQEFFVQDFSQEWGPAGEFVGLLAE